jgi:hypothetical protein
MRTATGFSPFASWQDVRTVAATDAVLWYWGAMDTAPRRVRVVRLFRNGNIRVDPDSNQADPFTLDPGHLSAGLLYRKDAASLVSRSMHCDQCAMATINGVPCHERGCPNLNARWDGEQWIQQATCRECGYTVDVGDECCTEEE